MKLKQYFVIVLSLLEASCLLLNHPPNLKQENKKLLRTVRLMSPPEARLRMSLLSRSRDQARKHNAEPDRAFNMALNKFSLMTATEKQLYLGLDLNRTMEEENAAQKFLVDPARAISVSSVSSSVPASYNHRTQGHVTAVKDQSSCGSCWAFAAVGAFEGSYSRVTGVLKSFSEKEVLDCTYAKPKNGCKGGWYTAAWEYVKKAGRLGSQRDIPYFPECGECSRWNDSPNGIKNADYIGYYRPVSKKSEHIEKVISLYTPAAAFTAEKDFFSYSDGLYDGCKTKGRLNHGLLLVGYGPDHWEAKNSWGRDWGDEGFVKFSRKRVRSVCQIASHLYYPVVVSRDRGEEDQPDTVPENELTNVALYKSTMSSDHLYSSEGTDGNTDTCFTTRSSMNPYFKLYLGKVYRVQRIEIVTKKGSNVIGSKVHIGNSGNFLDKRVGVIETTDEEEIIMKLDTPVEGSHLYWELYSQDGARDLVACEIRVYAKDKNNGECPAGTIKCSDGVCRHSHMCNRA